jgi:uncharacterized protein (TIGR03435 family)
MLFVMSKCIALFAALLAFFGGVDARAQPSAAVSPRFEAASIKPVAPDATEISCMTGIHIDASRFSMPCTTMRGMIAWAFDLKTIPIEGGPASSDTKYQVVATAGSAVGAEQLRLMMQALLADRFQLKVHRETPVRPVFALVIAKSGLKMHTAESGNGQVMFSMAGKEKILTGSKVSMSQVLPWLRSMAPERPIVDETGLTGAYEFRLQWLPDNDQPTVAFFSAVQDQLGLKLEDRKAPVEIMVIDHAEKPAADQ